MTWLSEIEDKNEIDKGFVEADIAMPQSIARERRVSIHRMARVIRDLVGHLEVICELKDIDLTSWPGISPDAKELLE